MQLYVYWYKIFFYKSSLFALLRIKRDISNIVKSYFIIENFALYIELSIHWVNFK